MRIGEPARKHGVADTGIWHAARTAVRRIVMDEDLTMLIGQPPTERYWISAFSTLREMIRSSSTRCR